MKVPNLFLPEKKLEEKTENLLNKETIPKKYEPKIEKQELEETLNSFDSSAIHKKIDDLVTRSGYAPVKMRRLKWDYWTKSTDFDEDYIFIRWHDQIDTRYAFAIVKNDKIKEFCTRFEKVQSKVSPPNYDFNDFAMCITKGLIIGGVAGIVFRYASIPIEVGHYLTVFTFGLGAIPGSLVGAISYFYNNSRNKKRLKTCYTQLITEDRTAVETAFS